MRKTILVFLILTSMGFFPFLDCSTNYLLNNVACAKLFQKKQQPILILTPNDPDISKAKINDIIPKQYFAVNSRIYFVLYNPQGFKNDYIRYQIVKQNPNAHVGGFERKRNITVRIKDKYYFKDYITLSEAGKYFIQIFDIENLQHWIAISSFIVLNN